MDSGVEVDIGRLPTAARIVEVGPRDGLQNEAAMVPAKTKVAFIDGLSRSGLRDIEVTSFVSPAAVPQLADASEVLKGIEKRDGVRYWVLVPNVKGLDRWLDCAHCLPAGSRGIALFTAASATFSQRNIGATVAQSLDRFDEVMTRLRSEMGADMPRVRGYVSMAFLSPYPNEIIDPAEVETICDRLINLGVDELSLGDTVGAATPRHVDLLLDRLIPRFGRSRLAMHFHDTRGTALANVLRSLEHGISTFDSSAGGLGGCPFAPGATGNLSTEDLVYLLEGMEIETGVNIEALAAASALIRPALGHELASRTLAAIESAEAQKASSAEPSP